MTSEEFFNRYLRDTHQDPEEAVYSGQLYFEDTGVTGITQLDLVLSEQKTAIFTPLESFEINREPMPVDGEVYIVEDSQERPRAIIEITDVKVIPFNEITPELALRDGEDESFEDWKDKQTEFFKEEAEICGFKFSPSMPVVCEIFQVVYRK